MSDSGWTAALARVAGYVPEVPKAAIHGAARCAHLKSLLVHAFEQFLIMLAYTVVAGVIWGVHLSSENGASYETKQTRISLQNSSGLRPAHSGRLGESW